ncbi:hypothetical protein DFV88_24770 [Salmonella enterica subsp. enterica serovar Newport]|nr:hypothetical protein [Salmonella enterica subsp. enterica serovar Newport]
MKTFLTFLLTVAVLIALAFKFEIVAVVLWLTVFKAIDLYHAFSVWANSTAGLIVIAVIYLSWKIEDLKK